MSFTQFLLCLFGITAGFSLSYVEARSARLTTEEIIGGDNANRGEFPYQVSLHAHGQIFCGGSILTERFILTAAHCVVQIDNSFSDRSIKVVAGINNLNTKSGRFAIDVVEVFVPKEYDRTVLKDGTIPIGDIAILKLKKKLPIKGNSKLGEVKLPKKDATYVGKKATISGFGLNDIEVVTDPKTGRAEEVNGVSFHKMRYAKSKVRSSETCRKLFSPLKLNKSHICAGVVQRDKKRPEGVCSGDSGGPLVYHGAQIGVLSISPFGCREHITPSIYTRVTDYLDFIDKVINDETDKTIRTKLLKDSH